ncbi:metallophosphoesterase [Brevibacillus ruminantium]|uniref:Metallophosphoesterase n=1 Tax=Brevibacillus ruminantium TaxID=2950604 RepID=A0ABY4WD10_9BACL|nr:metallophosphoesterase [Brevibacillus ruminantium]USG63812.1 metallophosphoesterase [Brevibacillus ruminantium]
MTWIFFSLFIIVLFARAYRNTFDVNTTSVGIALKPSDRLADAERHAPLSILHLSDLHMENISVKAEQIVRDYSEESIDLIAITGDLLDRHKNIPKAVHYVETIMSLRPRLGTFVVLGNHDYVLPLPKLAQLTAELKRLGCQVLINEHVTMELDGRPLHIIGVDDYGTGHSNLKKAFQDIPEEGLRLVLTHDPNLVLEMKDYAYDYLLSGHFHGGQIHWPKPFHLAKMGKLPKLNMVKGLHHYDGRPFYISEGLGQTGLNIRLRSRPEITLHTLAPASYFSSVEARNMTFPERTSHVGVHTIPAAEAASTLAVD